MTTGKMVLLRGFVFNSMTNGGKVLYAISLLSGLVSLAVVVTLFRRKAKHNLTAEII